jgi:hypothetical protein
MRTSTAKLPHREFDLTVGELPPVFEDRHRSALQKLIEDFVDFCCTGPSRGEPFSPLGPRDVATC